MRIKVPATSANLGPGFDSLGLAISLYNYVTIKPYSCQSVSIKGEGENRSRLKVNNIFVSIFNEIYQDLVGKKDNFRFEFENYIPFSRGLGSSSAVIVGAIASAYHMANVKVTKQSVLNKALEYESHPDNIAPAVYGGFTTSVIDEGVVKTLKKDLPKNIKVVMVIPDRAMSTAHSRTQLPKSYSMKDVIFNSSRVGLMSAAFFSENWELLRSVSKDRIHENRRMKKMKELFEVRKIALANGALMSTLSGSGSSFFSMTYEKNEQKLIEKLKNRFENFKIVSFDFDNLGYEIIES
ncbi:homoserine kinase [Sulfurospirillum arcachonense]|uniref:homoserine kinase n=1 Tax=Sulfurospirillum arcachonense TaxID=57666 RepID=UPI000469FDA5|nr:homoserine kinase [Sulfurospirillum arcachonense]